jgi:serine/threonine-protein kinase HipA
VGDSRHYRLEEIEGRHFVQTVRRARLPETLALDALKDVAESADKVMTAVEKQLPPHFPEEFHAAVSKGLSSRLAKL